MAYCTRFLNINNQKFTFLPTSEDEFLKLLKNTNPEKAAGIGNFSKRFLKYGAVVLYKLLMKPSKFPLDFKVVKLKPFYKKGLKTDPGILLLVSKVVEKLIHNQAENFPNKNKILYKYQSVFRKLFSTNSCLSLLTDKINVLNQGSAPFSFN